MVFCAASPHEKWLLCCLEKNCVRLHRKRACPRCQPSRYTNGYGSNGEKNYDKQQRGRHDRWMSCLLVFSRGRILMALASQCMDQRRQCIGNERTGRQLILDPREQRSSTVIGRPGRPISMARDTDARKRDQGSWHSLSTGCVNGIIGCGWGQVAEHIANLCRVFGEFSGLLSGRRDGREMIGIHPPFQASKALETGKRWLAPDGGGEKPVQSFVPCSLCALTQRQHLMAAWAAQDPGHLDQGVAGVRAGRLDEVASLIGNIPQQEGDIWVPSGKIVFGHDVAIDDWVPDQVCGRMHLARRRKDARKGKRRIEDVSRRNVPKLTQIVTSQMVKQALRSLLRLLIGARWNKREGFKASTLEDSAMVIFTQNCAVPKEDS